MYGFLMFVMVAIVLIALFGSIALGILKAFVVIPFGLLLFVLVCVAATVIISFLSLHRRLEHWLRKKEAENAHSVKVP